MLIKNAEIDGRQQDLRFTDDIVAMADHLEAQGDDVFNARGCAVLPGLHDHHIHLFASAAMAHSVDCAGLSKDQLVQNLKDLSGHGWARGVNYHEQIAGDLDRHGLDRLCDSRPLRLQHASGKLWILNSAAIDELQLKETSEQGIDRDVHGVPTGRLWRMDGWLRARLSQVERLSDLSVLSANLAAFGVTGVTDASYTNTRRTQKQFERAWREGQLRQRVMVMGDETVVDGPLKVMLDDDNLPDFSSLTERVAEAHAQGRAVAFHCVSHLELVFALATLRETGAERRDRIEHAGVVRPDCMQELVQLGVTVVTQPGFLWTKGERYCRQAEAQDVEYLYPYASLLRAGVPVAASSDAPYGPMNPWQVMAAAVQRRTLQGRVMNAKECVFPDEALRGYLAPPESPGGAARTLQVGAKADLICLDRPLVEALEDLADVSVRATWVAGRQTYRAS